MAKPQTLSGSFTATGVSTEADNAIVSERNFNISVSGTFVGTVQLQRSFDGGTTWVVVKEMTDVYEGAGIEAESKTQYRFECTAYTSGTINYRLGLTSFN